MKKPEVCKKKGRWGAVHWVIEGLNKGDYQKTGNKTFDSEEDAVKYLKSILAKE